jgi:hypothetical protein
MLRGAVRWPQSWPQVSQLCVHASLKSVRLLLSNSTPLKNRFALSQAAEGFCFLPLFILV